MPAQDALETLFRDVYERGELFGVDRPLPADPFRKPGARAQSVAIAGAAFGDEGKGRIVDEYCGRFTHTADRMVIYRWNGGANAGHTVYVGDQRVALHQLPAGSLHERAIVVLGKGMVIHPGDLLVEIEQVRPLIARHARFDLRIDSEAVLALDTHRAFEAALRDWATGGQGSTGRGIAPAYADVLFRHPVRMSDLAAPDWDTRLSRHYDLYTALMRGLGADMSAAQVPSLASGRVAVGDRASFLRRMGEQAGALRDYIEPRTHALIRATWADETTPFVFEGAQGIGLDVRWGVYPDVTASDPTFTGIAHATEGVVLPERVAVRAGALKATYISSVGARRLPTQMDDAMAHRIREDAHEYGATTRRPRDIAHIDLPCLRFFIDVSGMEYLVLTHLDIAYSDAPIWVCTHYTDQRGERVPYRPDQAYLNSVTPHYVKLPSWDGQAVQGARTLNQVPREAVQYIAYLTQALRVKPLMATTGPQREAVIAWA